MAHRLTGKVRMMRGRDTATSRSVLAALCTLALTLLLSVLVLAFSAPSSTAQQIVDEVCVEGTYVGDACEVLTQQTPDCAEDTCAVEVDRSVGVRTELAEQGPRRCPDGARGTGDTICYIYVATQDDRCPRGSVALVSGFCAQLVAYARGSYSCPTGGRLIAQNDVLNCVFDDEPIYEACPTGSEALNGACTSLAIQGLSASCGLLSEDIASLRCLSPAERYADDASVCEAGTQYVTDADLLADGCVGGLADGRSTLICYYPDIPNVGDFDGGCSSRASALLLRCNPGYSRDSSLEALGSPADERCHRITPAPSAPVGSVRCANGQVTAATDACFIPSSLPQSLSDSICPATYVIDDASTGCVLIENAIASGPICPASASGTLDNCYLVVSARTCVDGTQIANSCLIRDDEEPVRGSGECPVSSTVFLDGEFCYVIVDPISPGVCPANSENFDGECRRATVIPPGPLSCADPDLSLINGACFRTETPTGPIGQCPDDYTLATGTDECRLAVPNTSSIYSCPDATAELVGTTCVSTAEFVAEPAQGDYTCDQGTRQVGGDGFGSVVCIVGVPLADEGPYCLEGRLIGRFCLFSEPFIEIVCPDGYDVRAGGLFCELGLPSNDLIVCAVDAMPVVDAAGVTQCLERTGPQPGACPDADIDGQCYRFVDHTLQCEPAGCAVSVPAVPSAPAAERGDIDCNTNRDIRDALAIARLLADTEIARERTCDAVTQGDGLRITAADTNRDGTIDGADATRLLQCLVDDTLGSCAG